MSTQTSQFLIWGIQMPYAWHKEWEKANPGKGGSLDSFYTHFEPFITDNAHKKEMPAHNDGIMCLFDGRDGRYIIIGRILAYASNGCMIGEDEPVVVKPLTELEQELIRNSVKRNFGVEGEFGFLFVTHYS